MTIILVLPALDDYYYIISNDSKKSNNLHLYLDSVT